MNFIRSALIMIMFVLLSGGCGNNGGEGAELSETEGLADLTTELSDVLLGDLDDIANDQTSGDEGTEVAAGDIVGDETTSDVPMVKRRFTFRAIGGISMGAVAATIASHRPDWFDVVGSLGGYLDYRYMGHMFRDHLLKGFCPMGQILKNLDKIDDPNAEGVYCGPIPRDQPHEWLWDFNHFRYNDSGGHWQREFYFQVMGSFAYAFGNMLYYNPENPLLPPGVPYEWFRNTPDAEKCKQPYRVGKPFNYNAEYNPKGEYDLVTVCDGDFKPPCPKGDWKACTDDPEYRKALGWYNPAAPHNFFVKTLLAVDYNGNGRRDYGEPVVVNASERWRDVGSDGCASEYEDGKGGCLDEPVAQGDPNHDDFDLEKNPFGTEHNFEWDEGEPYDDYGLDGVPDTHDFGEGDGEFTINPNFKELIDGDARNFFMNAPEEQLRAITWYFDGGINDALHSLTSSEHLVAWLNKRGMPVKIWEDFTRTKDSIMPNQALETMVALFEQIDFSPKAFGRNVMVRYGDPAGSTPDADYAGTWEAFLAGNGSHVGGGTEVLLRPMVFYAFAVNRMPDPIYKTTGSPGRIEYSSHYSEALQGRRWFAVTLPPGYDDPENAEERYPLALFMPGIGMPVYDMVTGTSLFTLLMEQGRFPRFILLTPDGQCARRKKSDGTRLTGCLDFPEGFVCVDDTCKGEHESCKQFKLEESTVQECNSGHFFVNHKSDIWGDTSYAPVMRYEDELYELIEWVDQHYRTRKPAVVEVPADW